jgi:ribonuclease R
MKRSRSGKSPPHSNDKKNKQTPDWRHEDPNLELEKSRYADPIASRELLLKHLADAPEPLSAARLAKRLGINGRAASDALAKRLAAMVRDGQAIEGPNGFAVAGEGERLSGRVRGRASGEVQILPEDASAPLVLARGDAASLMHNDRVEVLAVGMNERGRRIARLIRRLGDAPTRLGGLWLSGHDPGRVEPEDPGHWYDIEVPSAERNGANPGDSVIVEITKRPRGELPAQGRVVEVLRDMRPSDLAARFAILRHDLPQDFPREVLQAANRFPPEVQSEELAGREDLRELPLVTIDGEDARDFDDAVYAESVAGGWRLIVAIADVSHYVRHGDVLNIEARARATSVYFPDRVIPMLPEHLSNHLCSLMPHVARLSFVCDMHVSKGGKLSKARFYEAVIRSHARLTYTKAWAYLKGLKTDSATDAEREGETLSEFTGPIRASLENLHGVFLALKRARDARGALDFRGGEVKARIGAGGTIEGFYSMPRNDAHLLIEECMIAANVEAASALRKAKAAGLYRVHGQPEDKRVDELTRVLTALGVGVTLSEKPEPREFRQLIERLAGRPDGQLLEGQVIRSLAQAVYQQTNIGHFGLALKEYAHFTSPIRRYPDLVVHRALKAALVPKSQAGYRYSNAELLTLGLECSLRERRADDASRDVLGYLKCLYLQPRVGEIFEATITSAQEFGLFVQLKEMPIDGLVHVSNIPGDYWELEAGGVGLIGQRTHRRWQLGQSVKVRLARVDVTQRQIDFDLIDGEALGAGTVHAPRRGSREPRRSQHGSSRGNARRGSKGRRG